MKTISKKQKAMNVVTGLKAGGVAPWNHNRRPSALSVKTGLKAGEGILNANHNRRAA